VLVPLAGWLLALGVGACGSGSHVPVVTTVSRLAATSTSTASAATGATSSTTTTTSTPALPGTGKPAVVIGDENFTEQFLLGQMYADALQAQGYRVTVYRNIGATSVRIPALMSGRIAMYPEYLQVWNTQIAGDPGSYGTRVAAYAAGQRWALAHGLVLLRPTPFSDTDGIAVTVGYAQANHVKTIGDLRNVATPLTLGWPPEPVQVPSLLSNVQAAYGLMPGSVKQVAIGDQYQALNVGSIQAAHVQTTDGQLATGDYLVLKDPGDVFGWGNVVPVVPASVLAAEGPAFAATINRVSALLTTSAMRELNALVDVAGENYGAVAQQFLETHGVIPPKPA
jgi:glycine betaine/choline ABC-type transport system substrate-binding protein